MHRPDYKGCGSGKRWRVSLGNKEKQSLLRMAYQMYAEGSEIDLERLRRSIDNRAAKFVDYYFVGDFPQELAEYVTEREALIDKARAARAAHG